MSNDLNSAYSYFNDDEDDDATGETNNNENFKYQNSE